MVKFEIVNNFNLLKDKFKTDTGLDWKDNIEIYVKYYQGMVQDAAFQLIDLRLRELNALLSAEQEKKEPL